MAHIYHLNKVINEKRNPYNADRNKLINTIIPMR